jgi:hypothetical protein
MSEGFVNAIVRCAYRICLIYFLKCFLPSINIGPYMGICSTSNYDKELQTQISKLRKIIIRKDISESDNKSTACSGDNHSNVTCSTDTRSTDTRSTDTCSSSGSESDVKAKVEAKNNHDNKKTTKTKEREESSKKAAMSEIKQTITAQLKERYGDDIAIDFSHDTVQTKDKCLYAIKIKELGKSMPKENDFEESDIYVNTDKKVFYVRTKSGFKVYPLTKRSIIRCEKTD